MTSPTPSPRRLAALPLTMTALFLAFALGGCRTTKVPTSDVADVSSANEADGSEADSPDSAGVTESPAADAPNDSAPAAAGPAALVNDEPVPMAEFQKQAFDTQRYHVDQGGIDPNTTEGQQKLLFLRRQVLRDMIDQKLMEQAAQELNVSVTDEDLDAEMKRLIDEVGGQAAFVRKLLPKAHFATLYAKPEGRPIVDTCVKEFKQNKWIYFPWDIDYHFVKTIKDGGRARRDVAE